MFPIFKDLILSSADQKETSSDEKQFAFDNSSELIMCIIVVLSVRDSFGMTLYSLKFDKCALFSTAGHRRISIHSRSLQSFSAVCNQWLMSKVLYVTFKKFMLLMTPVAIK